MFVHFIFFCTPSRDFYGGVDVWRSGGCDNLQWYEKYSKNLSQINHWLFLFFLWKGGFHYNLYQKRTHLHALINLIWKGPKSFNEVLKATIKRFPILSNLNSCSFLGIYWGKMESALLIAQMTCCPKEVTSMLV